MHPLVEAYLLVEQPRQRIGHWTQALAPLDSAEAPPLAQVIALYDPTTDQAILNLRYDELALGDRKLEFVVEIALLAEIGMIQPAELSEGERRRFLTERLARCTLQISHQRNAVAALTELVKKLRAQRNSSRPPNVVQSVNPRGDTSDPIPLISAKGTRNQTDPIPLITAKGTRNDIPQLAPFPRPSSPHKHVVSRSSRAETVVALTTDDFDDFDEPFENEFDAPSETKPAPYVQLARAQSPKQVAPPELPVEANMIYARYLRSGKWVPIRIGALSLKGAALMTGALPRLHDHVDVALSFAGHRALVRGAVGKVSTLVEAQTTGASTFSVAFELDQASRRQLTALLTAARDAKVTIKPPPPRATRRFVVEWPVCLGTMRGAMKADALDISTSGMFVRPVASLTVDTVLNFSAVIDDGGGPVAGRAKVVRQLSEPEAASVGLAPGFGLSIVDMSQDDRTRWDSFITRIEHRAEKRVLIGAAPVRLGELQQALSAAGYAVMGGTDPGALVQLSNADARPVDAVVLDANWLGDSSSATWVEALFTSRDVPCVTLTGDARRARTHVDKLLAVELPDGPKSNTIARS